MTANPPATQAQSPVRQPRPEPRPRASLPLCLLALALLGASAPAGATHPQSSTTDGKTFTLEFDHDGDNEWWVEVQVRGSNGDFAVVLDTIVEGGGSHNMQQVANTWERTEQGWGKWAPRGGEAFQVPPGKRVMFRATVVDGATGDQGFVESCWFTHPAGVEQCGTGSGFDASFTGVRGNEWWVQAQVATNGPPIAAVDVTTDNGASWKPLMRQSWGWAASTHVPDGTVVRLRATASDGQVDLSSCRQWIPPSGQNAAIVPCPGASFQATFAGVRGNDWWAEAVITANAPVNVVFLTVDCQGEPHDMVYKADWGKWVLGGTRIPPGSKVTMTAYGGSGSDGSGGYVWPDATPTEGCSTS